MASFTKYLLTLCDYIVMMRVSKIAMMVVATLVVATLFSCNDELDNKLVQQQNGIANYLKGSHQPRLIPESELSTSFDENPPFYTQWGLDIYRYIATYYDEGRAEKLEIDNGDIVALKYTAYIFRNSKPQTADMFATNKQESIDELKALGLNTSYEWTTDPHIAKIGNKELLQGLETALKGCREGDSVEIYLTFESGYGNKYIGMVPNKSAIVWYVDIVSVEKK